MSGNIAITGPPTAPGPNGEFDNTPFNADQLTQVLGEVPLRREIRDLQTNFPDQFNLYILGLQHLQSLDESQLTSYYQIAGIHGLPYKPWNGVGSTSDWRSSSGFGGYCTHSSILFVPWHRPYLALYEQALCSSVQTVAQQFPPGPLLDRYVTAARDFRAPYFDWASLPPAGQPAFPTAISSPTVSVISTSGLPSTIPNPLNRFTFHPLNPSPGDFTSQWTRYPTTVRYPSRTTNQSQDALISPILSNELSSLRSNVVLLLLSYTAFDAFSFNRWDPSTNPGAFGSLEDIHNEIHDRLGGGGHMSSLEVSAFDPVFWLHHANVDRLWAIWQDLNPQSFVEPKEAPYSTFWTRGGEIEDENTALKPFWDGTGREFWTSDKVRSEKIFGYAYPEMQRWRFKTDGEYRDSLRRVAGGLYGDLLGGVKREEETVSGAVDSLAKLSLGVATATRIPGVSAVEEKRVAVVGDDKGVVADGELTESPVPDSMKHLAPDNTYTEWVVNIRTQKHGLGESFRIQVFLGDIDEDHPDGWDNEWNCVGRVSVLGRAPETQCAKCHVDRAEGLMVSGTVPLTSALLQDITGGQVASLDPAHVVPHLRACLKWKVKLFTGEERLAEEIPELRVSVASTRVTIADDGLPIYSGQYTVHPEATHGKPAGLRDGDHI